MNLLLCPRCRRANPNEARYCHFDGCELRGVNGSAGRGGDLGREFVFPSGFRCRTFDDLVRGCMQDWPLARNMLRQGGLRQFMAGIGRMDLATAAERAAGETDHDLGLDQFLAQLPTRENAGPRLELTPRRIDLGRLRVGETRQIPLLVSNHGTRLLHGTVQVEGEDWLRLAPTGAANALIKAGKQQQLTLMVDTTGLIAGQRYAAKLTFITNGGAAEVPVLFEVGTVPFPHAPFQGALSARDLASRMKDRDVAKQAGVLLENGEVQRWFQTNGWHYPVEGSTARGVAAVQQFFEALGLSKPPDVQVSTEQVDLRVVEGETVEGSVTIATAAKKWVYARLESEEPWLTIPNPDVGGAQQAVGTFVVDGAVLRGRPAASGLLTVITNGGVRQTVTVNVRVVRAPARLGGKLLRAAALGAGIGALGRLLAALPDVLTRPASEFGTWLPANATEALPAYVRIFVLAVAWLGVPLGAWLLYKRSGLRDVPAGAIVGGVTGVFVAATLACLLAVAEQLARQLLPFTFPGSAIVVWGVLGTGLGLLVGSLRLLPSSPPLSKGGLGG